MPHAMSPKIERTTMKIRMSANPRRTESQAAFHVSTRPQPGQYGADGSIRYWHVGQNLRLSLLHIGHRSSSGANVPEVQYRHRTLPAIGLSLDRGANVFIPSAYAAYPVRVN